MLSLIRAAFVCVLLSSAVLGLALPLGMTGVAAVLAPNQAGGSMVQEGGSAIGSSLIGQSFAQAGYFHPRPSFAGAGYDASAAAASQLAPTSAKLIAGVRERIVELNTSEVPADAVTASASGLDPDISPENAMLQVPRVAVARGLAEARLRALVVQHIRSPDLGFLGVPHVNVLELNIALNQLR